MTQQTGEDSVRFLLVSVSRYSEKLGEVLLKGFSDLIGFVYELTVLVYQRRVESFIHTNTNSPTHVSFVGLRVQ